MDDLDNDVPLPDANADDRLSDDEDKLNDSDDESLLSEVDEAQFADFDPSAVQVAPDFETLNRAGKIKKRQRPEGEEGPKKTKERTRERVKRNRRRRDSDEGFSGGEEIEGKRARKGKSGGDGEKKKVVRVEINEDDLSPEERRRRALDRAMDAAVKKTTVKRIKKGDIVSVVL
jgi:transcription factor SPN1